MGRTIIKFGGQSRTDAAESSPTRCVEEPVSAESAWSSVTGEGACIVDSTLLRKYLARKYLNADAEGANTLGVLVAEAASESPDLHSKSIIYEDWKS